MLSSLKYTWKSVFGSKAFVVDNVVLWYFYSFTCILYFFCGTLLTLREISGDALNCESRRPASMSNQLMESWCLASGTFTLVDDERTLEQKLDTWCKYDSTHKLNYKTWCPPYNNPPKIRKVWNVAPWVGFEQFHQKKHFNRYYGLVIFYLLFASFCWYIPKLLWRRLEDSRMSDMCSDIGQPNTNMRRVAVQGQEKERITKLLKYFLHNGDWHYSYVMKKLFCETMTIFITAAIYYGACKFLDNDFWYYGFTIIWYMMDPSKYDGRDPQFPGEYPIIWDYFPLVSKCSFHTFGYSGTQQRQDLLCVLNYNKICGHLFFVLWINFIICAILSGGLLIFRVASFLSWRIRHIQMTGEIRINPTTYPLVKKLTYPKFLVLMVVGENCHALLYDRLLEHLAAFEGVGANDIDENPENDRISIGKSDSVKTYRSAFEKLPSGYDDSICEYTGSKLASHLGTQEQRYEMLLDYECGDPWLPSRIQPNNMEECPENGIRSFGESALMRTLERTSYPDHHGSMKEYPEIKIHNHFGFPATKKLTPFGFDRIGSITSGQRSQFLDFENLRDDLSEQTKDD